MPDRRVVMSERRGLLWLALGTVYVVWGSTYLAIRVVVRTLPPFLSAGSRFVLAGVVLALVIGVRTSWSRLRVRRHELGACILVGALLLLGGNGLVVVAEQHIDSGLAALVVAAVPLWVVLLRLGTGDRPPRVTLVGVLVGFSGIAVLLAPGGSATHTLGIITVLIASLSWSIGSFSSASLPLPSDPFVTTVYEMLAGGTLMLAVAVARGELGQLQMSEVSAKSLAAFAYLVVAGSLLAFTAYVWLLRSAPISLVATYAYVNPTVAVLLGALILGEHVGWPVLVGGALVIASVAAIVSVEQRVRKPSSRAPSAPVSPGPPVVDLAAGSGSGSGTGSGTGGGSGSGTASRSGGAHGRAEQHVEGVVADCP